MTQLTDSATVARLIEGLRAGDEASYRQIYALLAPRLHRTIARIVHDPQTALDAVQSTFLILFRRIDRFDGRSSLLTWMTRIALREGARLARRAAPPIGAVEPQSGESASPEAQYGIQELGQRLRALIDALPEEKRVPLLLFEVEEMSVREIAEIMDEPRGTILARLSRTRTELREALRACEAASFEARVQRRRT